MIYQLTSFFNYVLSGNGYSFRRTFVWPEGAYKRGMLKRIQRRYRLPYFIETGTFGGATPKALHRLFKQLWTIELDATVYECARRKLSKYPNIVCIQGDSKEKLRDVVPQLDRAGLFWLDGHLFRPWNRSRRDCGAASR